MKKENSTTNKPLYFIVGTRAQLIKTAPLMKEIEMRGLPYVSIYTGQHTETIDDIWKQFGIKSPDIVLAGKNEASTFFRFFRWWSMMLFFLFRPKKVLKNGKGIVVTHGDTLTAVWGALIGKFSGNKVAHLESGLRSFDLLHPFPEEISRRIIFLFTDLYFCPNEWAVENVQKFRGVKINTGGNTLIDAVRIARQAEIPYAKKNPYCVISMHRIENLYPQSRLEENIRLIESISEKCPSVFILHPVTKNRLKNSGLLDILQKNPKISLENRLGFFEFIKLLAGAEFIVSDGGSNQEESSYLGIPCLLLRLRTERTEGLGENAVLSQYDSRCIKDFLSDYGRYKKVAISDLRSPSKNIVDHLITFSQ